jgi:heme/copper-type cytochrome/quinol oxidase subunit 4
VKLFLVALIERRPGVGYVASVVSTSAGFWAFLDKATKFGAFVSVVVGIAVGVVTLRVQLKQLRRRE